MRELGQLSLKLFAFTLAAGLLLALTNAVTEGPIAEQQARQANASRYAVMADADEFEALTDDGTYAQTVPSLTAIYRALKGGEPVGYTLNLSPAGYKGAIDMTVGISDGGAITGVTIDSQSETQGVGSKITGEDFLRQFTGKAASSDELENGIDTITGATVSSSAVKRAVQSAAQLSENVLGIEPHSATPMDPIDEYRVKTLPGASGFESVDLLSFLGDYDTIRGVKTAYSGSDIIGYSFDLAAKGYNGDILMTLGISSVEGRITGLDILENNESEGYGKRIEEAAYYEQYSGLELTDDALSTVDGVSGATNTSREVMRAVKQAISFYRQYLNGEGAPATIDDADALTDITNRMAGSEASFPLIEKVEQAELGGETIGYRFTTKAADGISGLTVDVISGRIAAIAYRGEGDAATQDNLNTLIGTQIAPDEVTDALTGATWTYDALDESVSQCAAFYAAYISGEEAAA